MKTLGTPTGRRSRAPRRAPGALGAGALALAALGAGCSSVPEVHLRLDPASYVYQGYMIGTQQGVSMVIEELRFQPEAKGSLIVELAIVNLRSGQIVVDTGLFEARVGDREVLAQEARSVMVSAGTLERMAVSFRTDAPSGDIERGTLKLGGIKLDTGEGLKFLASFFRLSEDELARERGEEP